MRTAGWWRGGCERSSRPARCTDVSPLELVQQVLEAVSHRRLEEGVIAAIEQLAECVGDAAGIEQSESVIEVVGHGAG